MQLYYKFRHNNLWQNLLDSGVISIVFGWPKIILIWEECFCLQVNQLGFFLK